MLHLADRRAAPGAGVTVTPNGEILNIHQTGQTAVNKWNDFSIGADATVNFTGTVDGFNSFNYVKDGPISEIYGQLNAIGGNIFIANPAGVQIGNSAQINVGSLYVTNRELEQSHLDAIAGKNTAAAIGDYLRTNGTIANPAAELMSLGSITSATSVTFDGSRIVLDTDRLFTSIRHIKAAQRMRSVHLMKTRQRSKTSLKTGRKSAAESAATCGSKTYSSFRPCGTIPTAGSPSATR